jgi:lauroyl/myristoyl acyltransferase
MLHQAIETASAKFPVICFRKKRLTVAIHAHFDMEKAEDVAAVKQMIEAAVSQIIKEGHAKIGYSVSDV